MNITFPRFLTILAAVASTAAVTLAKEVDLWFVPMSAENPFKEPILKWVKENFPKMLPKEVTVGDNYGPPIYQDAQQKFVVQGRNGKPDVIESVLEGMIAYQKAGLLEPMDGYFDKWADKDQFVPNTIQALTIGGKLYGVPYNTNVRVLLYRKDLFQKYGLNPPKTWDELLQSGATISAKESGVAGIGLTTKNGSVRTFQEFISWFFQVNGGENPVKYDDAAKKWVMNTSPEKLAQVFKLYYDIFFGSDPGAANLNTRGNDYQATDTDYVSGKTAMVPMGPWIYQNRLSGEVARKILEENTGVAPLPLPPGGKQATYMEVKPVSINAKSKEKDAAWDVVKALTSKQFVALENHLEGVNPPRKDVAELPDFKNDWWQQAFTAQLPTGVALVGINWGLVINDITESMQKVIYKNSSPEQAGKELYGTLEKRAKNNEL